MIVEIKPPQGVRASWIITPTPHETGLEIVRTGARRKTMRGWSYCLTSAVRAKTLRKVGYGRYTLVRL